MKKILLFLTLLIVVSIIFRNGLTNIWHETTAKEFFIPEQSSMQEFVPTQWNDGSGDWWLYGEDKSFYYALNLESNQPKYFKFKKGNEFRGFEKLNYHTWRN